MAALGYVFFSEFNYNIVCLFPRLMATHALHLWAAGQLRVVPPSHRAHGLHSGWDYIYNYCLLKTEQNQTIVVNYPQRAGKTRAIREEVACGNHKVILFPWTDCMDDCVHEVIFFFFLTEVDYVIIQGVGRCGLLRDSVVFISVFQDWCLAPRGL